MDKLSCIHIQFRDLHDPLERDISPLLVTGKKLTITNCTPRMLHCTKKILLHDNTIQHKSVHPLHPSGQVLVFTVVCAHLHKLSSSQQLIAGS